MASQFEKRQNKEAEKAAASEPTSKAYDVVQEGTEFFKVTVEYSLTDRTARVISKTKIGDSQAMAVYKMNELITKKLILKDKFKD